MAYGGQNWKNDPDHSTPINAENLNEMDDELVRVSGIADETIAARVGVDGTEYPNLGTAIREQINDANENFDDVIIKNESENLINPGDLISGNLDASTGQIVASDTYRVTEHYIPVKPKTKYSFKNIVNVAYYNIDKTFRTRESYSTSGATITTGPNTFYIRVSSNVQAYTWYANEGQSIIEKPWFKTEYVLNPDVEVKSDIEEITTLHKSANLINPNDRISGNIDASTGQIISSDTYEVTEHYIPVKPNTKYSCKNIVNVAFYENNKTFIWRSSYSTSGGSFTTGPKTFYIRVSSNVTGYRWYLNEGASVVEEAWFKTEYICKENVSIINQIDDIFSESGKAADAKKVGDEFDRIAGYEEFVIGRGSNLFDGVSITTGYYIADNGTISSDGGSNYTGLIPLSEDNYYVIYSKSAVAGQFRVHGYKNGVWVRMMFKSNAIKTKNIISIEKGNDIDAIRISYYRINCTIHWIGNGSYPLQTEIDRIWNELDSGASSRYYHGVYKCKKSDFEGWYKCLATDAEITSYGFRREKSYTDTIALYDTLVDNDYVTKNLLRTISITGLGDVSIYEYVFTPKKYTNSPLTASGQSQYRPTPKILLDGSMHGFEKGGTFGNFLFLYDLVNNWKENPILTNIRNYVEIHCIAVTNPYGFENNTYYNENSVNINRNFPCSTWEYSAPGAQGSGDEPGDQPETQMLINWVNANSDALAYLCIHTNGQYYSVGYPEMNACLYPNENYGDYYTHRFFNVINRHIEKQSLFWPDQYAEVDTTGICGRYQATTHTGTVDVWSLENATVNAMTLEGINGLRAYDEQDPAQIPLFSHTAMRIDAEIVGNFIADLMQEYCQS